MNASSIRCIAIALAIVLPGTALSAGLTTGHYRFEVKFSPAALDGSYPVSLENIELGYLDVTTRSTGALTGELRLRDRRSPVTGAVVTRKSFVGIRLTSMPEEGKLIMTGRLSGSRLAGEIRGASGSLACSADISTVAPLLVTFDLDLTVDGNGRVRGSGTATGVGQTIPVLVTGSSASKQCKLTVKGPDRFLWSGAGKPAESGFIASWKGRGFGAVVRGKRLPIAPQ